MTNNEPPISQNLQRDSSVAVTPLPSAAVEFIATVQDSTLIDYYRMVVKQRRLIAYCAVAVFVLGAIFTLKTTRQYEAVGRIMVSRDNGDVVSDQITQQAGGGSGGGDLNSEIETQANIIQSDSLALRVIQDLYLYREPDFAGKLAKVDFDGGLTPLGAPPEMDPTYQEAMLKTFKRNLVVVEVPNTRIIEIHFFCANPKLAANIAQHIAETLEQRGLQARYESTTHATEWLANQLNDLQHQVEQSEQSLVDYQKKAGIVGLDDKQNTIMSKLDDLNHALTVVQSDRAAKEANYQSMKSGLPELSAAVPASSQIYKLRQQETDLKGQYAQAMAQFGEEYPKVVAIANQLKELQSAIQEENKRIATQVHSDYEISKSREQSLNGIFEEQKQSALELSERSVEYKILERDAQSYRDLYESLNKTLKQAQVLASLQSSNISVIDTPVVPSHPSRPNIPRNLAISAVIGIAFGFVGAFTMEMLDNRIYRPEEVAAIVNLPVLVSIPLYSEADENISDLPELPGHVGAQPIGLISWQQPKSEWAEAYRALRTAMLLSSSGAPPKTLLVTSGLPQEGKSTTSLNIATVLAQRNRRVLLIDADLRRPSLHTVLNMKPEFGLSTVVAGETNLKDALIATAVPNLTVLPAGPLPPSPAELLGSDAMKRLLEECRNEFDFVIIDAPPVLSVTDSVILSVEVDAALIVIRAGYTTKHSLRRTCELLAGVGARVLGTVLNGMSIGIVDGYYYYGKTKYTDYYSSYSPEEGKNGTSARSASAKHS
jgi:exopolysaccharide transport family protein